MAESIYNSMKIDEYWEGDAAPNTQPLSWVTNRYDKLAARRKLGKISRIFGELKTKGVEAEEIKHGQELRLDADDGLLKVVEDIRLVSRAPTIAKGREFVEWKLFDERTQAMVDELLFAGAAVKAKFEGDKNPMDFARRVSYFTQAASGLQLVGRSSQGLDRRMTGYAAEFRPFETPVGSIVSYETITDEVRLRLTSATVLRPAN